MVSLLSACHLFYRFFERTGGQSWIIKEYGIRELQEMQEAGEVYETPDKLTSGENGEQIINLKGE